MRIKTKIDKYTKSKLLRAFEINAMEGNKPVGPLIVQVFFDDPLPSNDSVFGVDCSHRSYRIYHVTHQSGYETIIL